MAASLVLLPSAARAQDASKAETKCKYEQLLIQHGNERPRTMWGAECTTRVGEKVILRKLFEPVVTKNEAIDQISKFLKKGLDKALKDAGYR